MRTLRRLHAAAVAVAGGALAAALYGATRLAIVLLVSLVLALIVSAEALRVLASNREHRP